MKIVLACAKEKEEDDIEVWLERAAFGVCLMAKKAHPKPTDSVFPMYIASLKDDGTLILHFGISGVPGLELDEEGVIVHKTDIEYI